VLLYVALIFASVSDKKMLVTSARRYCDRACLLVRSLFDSFVHNARCDFSKSKKNPIFMKYNTCVDICAKVQY